jgi:long-chain fatty acid transport protein
MTQRSLSTFALILALAPAASASGFLLREQSASGLGNAFAGVSAGAQDISSLFWNPAVLPLYPSGDTALAASWIGIHMDLSGASGNRAPVFQPSQRPISGPPDLPNAVSQPILPSLNTTWRIGDRVYAGLSVNVPFGLATEYPDTFLGRYHALKTDLKIIDITPSLAFQADAWTFGVAFVARKADATISNAVDFGAIGNALGVPGFVPGGTDRVATLKGDCWAYGYKAGFTFQPAKDLRFGVSYSGKVTLKVDGKLTYDSVPAPFNSTFVDAGGKADVSLPATASAGFTWDVTSTFGLQGEAAWTGWSAFKELRVRFASAQPDSVTDENWKDTWFVSLGSTFKVAPDWTLRAGLAYDRSPVDNRTRTPRIPDSDRSWLSAGASYAISRTAAVDFGLTRIFGQTVPMGLKSGVSQSDPNFFRGDLSGTYKVGATIVALGARFRF